jgi:hypothetical protein
VLSALWEFIIHGKYKPLNRSIIHWNATEFHQQAL